MFTEQKTSQCVALQFHIAKFDRWDQIAVFETVSEIFVPKFRTWSGGSKYSTDIKNIIELVAVKNSEISRSGERV